MKALALALLAVALSACFVAVLVSAGDKYKMDIAGRGGVAYLYDRKDGRVWFCVGHGKLEGCTLISDKKKKSFLGL